MTAIEYAYQLIQMGFDVEYAIYLTCQVYNIDNVNLFTELIP